MAGEVRITGMEEAIATLRGLPDKLRGRALRNALAAGARMVRDAARRHAPVIDPADPMVVKGWRKPGTMRNAIVVRTSKIARREGNVGVFVNVRPAKGARFRGGKQVKATQRGAKSPNDPYYWRWVEFGTKRSKAVPFLRPAAQTLSAAFEAFKNALGPQLAKLNNDPKAPL
jgi:HK97 gp10 family phage protein